MTGNKTRLRGKTLEDQLRMLHQHYYRQRRALLWHSGTIARIVYDRRTHRPIPIPVDSRPDFEGLLIPSGRHITFDAKMSKTDTYRHPTSRTHQWRTICDIASAGGIAFLLIVVGNEDGINDHGWAVFPTSPDAPKIVSGKTVHLSEKNAVPVPPWPSAMFYIPDWLSIITGGTSAPDDHTYVHVADEQFAASFYLPPCI